MPNRTRETTWAPDSATSFVGRKSLTDGQRNGLALSLRLGVEAALSDRKPLDLNLADWTKIYECQADETIDWPWVGASNLRLPFAATQMDAFVAYIAAAAFGQRFYRVTGLTQDATQFAPLVERYYNAELMRHRSGAPTWHEAHVRQIGLGARDGNGTIEALWRKTKQVQKIATWTPRLDPDTQEPLMDDQGNRITDRNLMTVEAEVYNDVQLLPIPARNLITIPASATSIDNAVAVAKVEYLYESQLKEMVRAGIMDADEVEACLSYVPLGTSELPASEQPLEIYTAGGQISTGNAQGPQTSEFFAQRGPIEVYRIHSNQFDLDGDGVVEENIFWVHRTSWRMIGWMPSQYWNEHRPFFSFAPLPRMEEYNGFSMIERQGAIDQELSNIWNQRNNMINMAMSPPMWKRRGSDADTDENSWRPNTTWYSSVKEDIDFITPPNVPAPVSFEQEQSLAAYGEKFSGISNMAVGMENSGRRSATEVRNVAAATQSRMNICVLRFRANAREIINFIHSLKKQYQDSTRSFVDGKNALTVPPDILGLDYQIDVWGGDDPTDVSTRRTEIMALYDILSKSQLVMQDPLKQHAALEMVVDAFERPDIQRLIGTQEEMQAKMQQQQLAATLQQVGAAGGLQPPPGQTPQPGQPPQNGAPPQIQAQASPVPVPEMSANGQT